MAQEIWKDINGYVGLYQVSNLGRVRSLDHKVKNKNGYRIAKGKILSFKKSGSRNEYNSVGLSKNSKCEYYTVHSLVMNTFTEKPCYKCEINHIDENTRNNRLDNLEWCTRKYNTNYGNHNKRVSETKSKKVIQYDLQGNLINEFKSAKNAAEILCICRSAITHCCNGRSKTSNGYIWRYE